MLPSRGQRRPVVDERHFARPNAVTFLANLRVPEGPLAGKKLRLAPFQEQFVRNSLEPGINVACLSVARGAGKSALSAGLALGALLGLSDKQPRREVLIAARTLEQSRIAWQFACGFCAGLPTELRKRLIFRRSPRLEIEFEATGGPHILRAISADGRSALGLSPNLVLMDERGHWQADQGDELEGALMTAMGKRGGRAILISTSARDDAHAFSRWMDNDLPGVYRQEHRPTPGLPADDLPSLLLANPGSEFGIGASPEWLTAQARRAISQGGAALSNFRLLNRNERISGEARDALLTVDEWLRCEVTELPPRAGPCIIGLDVGGSASMTAAAYYWPETGRLECLGTFPSKPGLLDRGQSDGVGSRYVEMHNRGELSVLGDQTVPIVGWFAEVMRGPATLSLARYEGEGRRCRARTRLPRAHCPTRQPIPATTGPKIPCAAKSCPHGAQV